MILNEFFDKIYVINLDHRTDRWEKVVNSFKSIGLDNYERYSAIKTDNGWLGCNLSHLGVIEKSKENGYDNFLVFEDDFVLQDNFIESVTETIKQLPEDWDMFYLGGNLSMCKVKEQISKNITKVDSVLTTHCYAMRGTIYDKVLNESPIMPPQKGFLRGQVIDVYYSEKICPNHNTYICDPMLCTQDTGYSDIEKRVVNYSNLIKNT